MINTLFSILLLTLGLSLSTPSTIRAQSKPDDATMYRIFREMAEKGHVNSQARLGSCYAFGQGVAQDWDKAIFWWRKAAEAGSAGAQFGLGICYAEGNGVAKDDTQAFRWFLKAAEQGDAAAQHKVGVHYGMGRGVKEDNRLAASWFLKSAEQGFALAQVYLSTHYRYGRGMPKDTVEAYAWLTVASDKEEIAVEERAKVGAQMTPDARARGLQRAQELRRQIAFRKK